MNRQIRTIALDYSTSGDKAIVAGATGQVIKVLGYVLVATGAVNLKWLSGSTVIGGLMGFGAGGILAVPMTANLDLPYLQTAAGDALNLNLSGNIVVGGHVTVEVETA